MKKIVLLVVAAVLVSSGFAMAEEAKTAPAPTVKAIPTPQPETTTNTTVTEQQVKGKKAGIDATTVTEEQKVKTANKAGDVGTASASQTTVFFTVTGTSPTATNAEYMKLAEHLKKSKGVFSANCTYSVKECNAVIDPTVTNADQILSWAKKGQFALEMKKK
ncbi:MAG: hypothetical protein HY877_08890 [Deltaproteobacteria bacterium]|nr:hypothetical protein [Deltaproteobacteria bacterium]